MSLYKTIIILFLSSLCLVRVDAQVINNEVFKESIKTVRLYPSTNEVALPVISLNSKDQLIFTFDEISDDSKSYYYHFIHCNADWQPTDQNTHEYIDGFSYATIDDYDYSFNTVASYVHYRVQIPNMDMRIKQSGNYIISVYEDDPSKPILTKRFIVVENAVEIRPEIKLPRTKYNYKDYQEIIFDVHHRGILINNPHQEIKASILQNQRWDNAHIGVQPRFIKNNLLEFDNNGSVVFEAGNEFRRFDIRSLRFNGMGIRSIQNNNAYLILDEVRHLDKYFIESDYNGQFYIDVLEYNNRNVEADYVKVHFNFPMKAPMQDKKLYVGGIFNNYDASNDNQMKWNPASNMYENDIILKQGFYDYMYYFLDEEGNKSVAYTEGNDYDAENEYSIIIYYRAFGERYDRIIGYTRFNSRLQ
ncbi:MAG TPA: DUF5103 domain-containing protein [Chitinophagales bacterium]|nr:DUF5103 domain-containing protein [Chitinophagales bacterium]